MLYKQKFKKSVTHL